MTEPEEHLARFPIFSSPLELFEPPSEWTFDDFVNNTCIKTYPARDQGNCGSCYAFAAATMLSLRYCVAAAKAGIIYEKSPVFSTRDYVSCGVSRSHGYCQKMAGGGSYGGRYNDGCQGGYASLTMAYLRDWGLTWAACKPYRATSSRPSQLFLKPDPQYQRCGQTCTKAFREKHPTRSHEYFVGSNVRRYYGEKMMQQVSSQ